MRLYADILGLQFVTAPRYVSALAGANAKYGDTITFPVRFIQDGVVIEPDAGSLPLDLRLGFKANVPDANYTCSNWNGTSYAFTKTGSGSAAVYSIAVQLAGTALSALFNTSKDPVTLYMALKWIVNSVPLETATIPVQVDWEINTGTEGQVNPSNPVWPDPSIILTTINFHNIDLSGLPTSDPGGGKPWLNGGVICVGA